MHCLHSTKLMGILWLQDLGVYVWGGGGEVKGLHASGLLQCVYVHLYLGDAPLPPPPDFIIGGGHPLPGASP